VNKRINRINWINWNAKTAITLIPIGINNDHLSIHEKITQPRII